MRTYQFALRFWIGDTGVAQDQAIDLLYSAGCSDALVGLGAEGYLRLMFDRSARSLADARQSAVNDVIRALPGAWLVPN